MEIVTNPLPDGISKAPYSSANAAASERWSLRLLIAAAAWAPFPLGSNRPWSCALLVFAVIAASLLWAAANWRAPGSALTKFRPLIAPIVLAGTALIWGVIQILPWVPGAWAHPVWSIAADALHSPLAATISINPWRTGTELMKLAAYATVALLVFQLARRAERANRLLTALIWIGVCYAAYGLALKLLGTSQYRLLYPSAGYSPEFITGPFVLHNSFATYMGLAAIAAAVRLFARGSETVVADRGGRYFFLSLQQYVCGRGVWLIVAFLLMSSMLIASASRAGTLAALSGLIAVATVAGIMTGKRTTYLHKLGILAFVLVILMIFLLNGDLLHNRLNELVETGGLDSGRQIFWAAAGRMIHGAPLLGLGLGSFENAFPMYADKVFPYIVDKAHNDYLELAAGWGIPAAVAWISALAWCAVLCMRGVFIRHRHRVYPLIATGATALVAFHSAFDFSLQIPAVALTYAMILGLGLAQAFPTRQS
jgi:O-antigen ligase